ncbi:MAG TPA: hypothetical protein P5284_03210, partial [Candidatus Contendobacter sp.]|nr:hypothetical protein [Candidatus Contendobacter sp.]
MRGRADVDPHPVLGEGIARPLEAGASIHRHRTRRGVLEAGHRSSGLEQVAIPRDVVQVERLFQTFGAVGGNQQVDERTG